MRKDRKKGILPVLGRLTGERGSGVGEENFPVLIDNNSSGGSGAKVYPQIVTHSIYKTLPS